MNSKLQEENKTLHRVGLKISILVFVIVMSVPGCALLRQSSDSIASITQPIAISPPADETPTVDPAAEAELESMQEEIKRLEGVIAEKDKLIRNQNVRQKDQDQVLQEVNDEANRAQVKLHRLATKPSAASTIAEVEVAMKRLKQKEISVPDRALQLQAQRILNAATVFYDSDEYAASMNYATQAHDIINMILDQDRKGANSTVKFYAPVMLKTKVEVNLRKGPNKNTRILNTLEKGTSLTANAYHGDWLQVQTENDLQGWVFYSFVEIK